MEADRFKQNHTVFIICMICLIISLSLFTLALYILPFLLWRWRYGVPEFVFTWSEWFVENYEFTQAGAYGMVFLILFVPALITGVISYISSNFIENKVLDISTENPEELEKPAAKPRETFGLTMKVVLLIALVAGIIFLMQWMVLPGGD